MDKKAAIIISPGDFNDEEYFITKCVLEDSGLTTKTVSTAMGEVVGSFGGEAKVDYMIDDLNLTEFDGIILIGGAGASRYFDDEKIHKIIKDAVAENKVLGAICIAPVILAKAGVLKGKKATVWNSPLDRSPVKILKQGGAIYQNFDVVVDGNIVTANGPMSARRFGESLTRILK